MPRSAAGPHDVPSPADLAAEFPDLEILEFIGRGGMGIVYKARQKSLDRIVALKILSPAIASDPAFAERFSREARVLALLSHPHVVAVYDFGTTTPQGDEGRNVPLYYFLMEYIDGVTLRQLLAGGDLDAKQALAIVPQICQALQYAHDKGVVHRDIKPENILVDRQGSVKIADFGLAKLLALDHHEVTLSATGQVLGTLHYMAPEQMERPAQVDHRADIYSLGVVFYQMLTGELPLGRFQPPSQRVVVDARLDEVVLRALEREPERRYQQASALQSQVESIASTPSGSVSLADVQPARSFVRRLAGRRSPITWLMVVSICCFLGFVAWRLLVPELRIASQIKSYSPEMLADFPQGLRVASTPRVIDAAVAKPLSPWAWQELQKREISDEQMATIMQGLTEWLRREYPRGISEPLSWLDQALRVFDERTRITDQQKIDFLIALYGDLDGTPVVRLRTGTKKWTSQLAWKRWHWGSHFLGMDLMNELQSMTIDGVPIALSEVGRNWMGTNDNSWLTLPELPPGKHPARLTVLTALVAAADLTGLRNDAPSTEWPRAVKSWQREFVMEFDVYAPDADILRPERSPELSPLKQEFGIQPIVIRGGAQASNAGLEFICPKTMAVPIAFDVNLRIHDQTMPCGSIFLVKGRRLTTMSGTTLSVSLPPLPAGVSTADVILTPNPRLIDLNPDADSYWAEEIVLRNVKLRRLDR